MRNCIYLTDDLYKFNTLSEALNHANKNPEVTKITEKEIYNVCDEDLREEVVWVRNELNEKKSKLPNVITVRAKDLLRKNLICNDDLDKIEDKYVFNKVTSKVGDYLDNKFGKKGTWSSFVISVDRDNDDKPVNFVCSGIEWEDDSVDEALASGDVEKADKLQKQQDDLYDDAEYYDDHNAPAQAVQSRYEANKLQKKIDESQELKEDKDCKNLIWSNYYDDIDVDAWRDVFADEISYDYDLDNPEEKAEYEERVNNDDEVFDYALGMNNDQFEEEVDMLSDIKYPKGILVIADLGLWNGNVTGYKVIESGELEDCFESNDDYVRWYVDNDDEFAYDGSNHDGSNHYIYRAIREDVDEELLDKLYDIIYNGKYRSNRGTNVGKTINKFMLDECTRKIGPDILRVYGIEEGLEEGKKKKKKDKVRFVGNPEQEIAFFNNAMGNQVATADGGVGAVSMGESIESDYQKILDKHNIGKSSFVPSTAREWCDLKVISDTDTWAEDEPNFTPEFRKDVKSFIRRNKDFFNKVEKDN